MYYFFIIMFLLFPYGFESIPGPFPSPSELKKKDFIEV